MASSTDTTLSPVLAAAPMPGAALLARPVSDEAALADAVRAQVVASGTSFYWGMRVLPARRRDAMFAIYAFCRAVDDIADGDDPPPLRQAKLDQWRLEVTAIHHGTPATPTGQALQIASRRFALAEADMRAVIDGMQMDAERVIVAPAMAELDLYCDRVASAVGRLSVRAFGAPEPHATEVAQALGRALQLTNILRDIEEDAARGRLYLPRELLVKHGIAELVHDLPALLARPEIAQVGADLGLVAAAWFRVADGAMARCPKRTMRPARIMQAVYARYLRALERRRFVLRGRPVRLSPLVKLWCALRYGAL